MRKILFVCSGNTCRSPLALAAWRALEKKGETPPNIHAASAGLAALNGCSATDHAITLARDWGEDLSEHRSRVLLLQTARSADRIMLMDRSHLPVVQKYFRVPRRKTLLLGAFDPQSDGDEILDPFGGSLATYELCAQKLYRAVKALAQTMRRERKTENS